MKRYVALFALLVGTGCGPKARDTGSVAPAPDTHKTVLSDTGQAELDSTALPGVEDIAKLRRQQKGADVSVWRGWAIVREPATKSGDMPAQLLRWEDGRWEGIASTTDGFWTMKDIQGYIPGLTPGGAQELGLFMK